MGIDRPGRSFSPDKRSILGGRLATAIELHAIRFFSSLRYFIYGYTPQAHEAIRTVEAKGTAHAMKTSKHIT